MINKTAHRLFPDGFNLQRAIKSLPHLFLLLLWDLPLRRESDSKRRFDIQVSYSMLLLALFVLLTEGRPYIIPSNFPALSQLPIIEGTLIQHPNKKNTRYSSAPIGIQTSAGNIYKRCSGLGVSCSFGLDHREDWSHFIGKPVRIWYLDDWIVQVEVDGNVTSGIPYERGRDRFTDFFAHFWMLLMVGGYIMFRLLQRYLYLAIQEAYQATLPNGHH